MFRALALLVALLLPTGAVAAREPDPPYAAETVAAWAEGPVHLSPDSGALTRQQAVMLATRIRGWRDDVYVAVVPAAALGGDHGPEAALRFLDAVQRGLGQPGVYIVSFSGAATYGSAYGVADRVGSIVAEQVAAHTRGQQFEILDGTLDELGAPPPKGTGAATDPDAGRDDGQGTGWTTVGIGVALVVVLAVGGALLWRRRPVRTELASGEVWGGPADFRPAHQVYEDEADTVQERAALAREDVTRLGEEIQRDDLPAADPEVAAHLQAGLDAYADASRRVDALTTDDQLRELGAVVEYARWRLACARALVAGQPAPARRVACFRDPDHGVSVADVRWTPPGGAERPVPVCRTCLDELSGERR